MTCHAKDRHVLAAAARSGAATLVTFNLRDFLAPSTEPYRVDVVDPHDFPLDLLDLAPRAVLDELQKRSVAAQSNCRRRYGWCYAPKEPLLVRRSLDWLGDRVAAWPEGIDVLVDAGRSDGSYPMLSRADAVVVWCRTDP